MDSVRVVNTRIERADSLDDDSYSPPPRVHPFIPVAPPSEDVATMPIEGRAEDVNLVPADCTISGDRGMLVLETPEPDSMPASPGERTRMIRLCAIVGVAMLIVGGLVWFPVRQSTNFATRSNQPPMQVTKSVAEEEVPSTVSPVAESDRAATIEKPTATTPSLPAAEETPAGSTPTSMQVAKSAATDQVPSTTMVVSRAAEKDHAVTIEKPTATTPSLPAAEETPAGGTPMPRQIAKSVAEDEGPSTTTVVSPEKGRAATIGKPIVAEPSVPAPEAAPAGGMPKPTSGSAALAPGTSSPVSAPAPPRQLDSNEIEMLIRRGKQFLADGDLPSARLLLGRAATAGSAEATFLLGTTFDPSFMRRVGVVGMELDPARAREWYTRAAELGSSEASQQLAIPQRVH